MKILDESDITFYFLLFCFSKASSNLALDKYFFFMTVVTIEDFKVNLFELDGDCIYLEALSMYKQITNSLIVLQILDGHSLLKLSNHLKIHGSVADKFLISTYAKHHKVAFRLTRIDMPVDLCLAMV